MKQLFSIGSILFLFIFLTIQATYGQTTSVNDSILLNYGGGSIANPQGIGTAEKCQMGAAIEFPASLMQRYKENQFSAIRFYLYKASQIDSIKVFIKKELEDDPLYIQKVTNYKQNSWNHIVLNQPVNITGESICIGYYIWSNGRPLAMRIEGTEAALGDWYFQKDAWKHVNTNGSAYVFAIEGIVKGEHLPQYDISLAQIKTPLYIETGKKYLCEGTLSNKGLGTVKEIEIASTDIEGNKQIYKVTGLDIPTKKTGSFIISDFTLKKSGDYEVIFEITKINGIEDYDLSDNKGKSPVMCREKFIQRNVLIENITSEKCTGCPEGHRVLDEACKDLNNIVRIEHHAGFLAEKGDPFSLAESREIFKYYSPSYEFAPALLLDRTNLKEYGVTSVHTTMSETMFGIGKTEEVKKLINVCREVPAFVSLDLNASYIEKDNSVEINVKTEKLDLPLLNEFAYLNIVIIEDSVKAIDQANGGLNYLHQHMIRKFVTPTFGEKVNMDTKVERNYKIEALPEEWNKDNLSIVAFVSNYDNVNNSNVYNAASVSLLHPNAMPQIENETDFRIYNQGNGTLLIEGEHLYVEAYTTEGIKIASTRTSLLQLEKATGIILLKLYCKNGIKSKKIIL